MKILYVITGLGLGGAEKVLVDLADKMLQRGHQVKIVYLTGKALVKPKETDIEIISLRLFNISNIIKAFIIYNKVLKDYKPDIVHAHMIHANIFTRINRIFFKVPYLLCSAHSSNEGGNVRMLMYRLTNFLSDFNSNVSNEATLSLINKGAFNKNNLSTVYNGVDLDRFKKNHVVKEDNYISILAVGRFNAAKDYPNLIHAISKLKKSTLVKFSLKIAGDGELRPLIENLIRELDLMDVIELLGKRSDIPDLLNKSDIFVLASEHEGLPTVVIEAMACQCYVVATDCGGTKEIMGETGIIVPKQDSDALAKGLLKALSLTSTERNDNNLNARMRVEQNFSLETSVNIWLKHYEK